MIRERVSDLVEFEPDESVTTRSIMFVRKGLRVYESAEVMEC